MPDIPYSASAAPDGVSLPLTLALSERQVRRLLDRIQTGGAASIRHKAIGRPSNNRINGGIRDYAVALVRESYADFGPTLATEKLAERDGLQASRETVRNWMVRASSGGRFTSRDFDVRPMASWCRLMVLSTVGLRIAGQRVRCWCSSTTRPAG